MKASPALKQQNTTALPKDLEELYGIFEGIEAPDKKELRRMFHRKENAVIEVSAKEKNAGYIVTRNIKDFKKSSVKAVTPEELLVMIER